MATDGYFAYNFHQFQVYQLVNGSALTLYVFDYLLTFDQEIKLVWASNWTLMKVLFLLDRYLLLPNFVIQQFLIGTVEWNESLDCQSLARAWTYLSTLEVFLSEAILSLRLWAMWGNSRVIFVGVMSMFMGTTIWQQYNAERAITSGGYSFNRVLSNSVRGCMFDARGNHINPHLITFTMDFVMAVLALIPTVRLYMSTKGQFKMQGSLIYSVYREGILFYIYILSYSAVCLAVVERSAANTFLLVPTYMVVRVVTSTRMILHTRQLYNNTTQSLSMPSSVNEPESNV